MTDVPYDAGSRRSVIAAQKDAKFIDDKRDEAFKTLMGSAGGRSYVWDLLSYCGVFHASFNPNGSNMYFSEGKRNVGLRLTSDIDRLCPESFLTMQREAKQTENPPSKTVDK